MIRSRTTDTSRSVTANCRWSGAPEQPRYRNLILAQQRSKKDVPQSGFGEMGNLGEDRLGIKRLLAS